MREEPRNEIVVVQREHTAQEKRLDMTRMALLQECSLSQGSVERIDRVQILLAKKSAAFEANTIHQIRGPCSATGVSRNEHRGGQTTRTVAVEWDQVRVVVTDDGIHRHRCIRCPKVRLDDVKYMTLRGLHIRDR